MRYCGVILLLSTPMHLALGQDSLRLVGEVRSPEGNRVPRASLIRKSSIAGTQDVFGASDSSGRFSLWVRPAERLSILALGFQPFDTSFVLADSAPRETILQFRERAALPEVIVTAPMDKPARYAHTTRLDEFYRRRARDRGTFFTREQIEASGKSEFAELLRGIPGVQVHQQQGRPLEIRFARCSVRNLSGSGLEGRTARPTDQPGQAIAVYLNGTQVGRQAAMDVLDNLSTLDVEAVEVYRGPSQLPPEAVGNACAAIFVWTRQ